MKITPGRLRPALAALTLIGGCVSMPVKASSRTEVRPEVHRLPNGLTVVLLEDHSAPVVALQTWVKFGSADERREHAGVAHVFEHMLFKGTERFPGGEIGGLIEAAGGVVNAWTSYDETVYHTVIASPYWERGFDVLSDAVLHSLLDAEELRKEIEVVREEIRRGKDNPDREVWERMAALAFKQHPYGRPVIGYDEVVAGLERDALADIYRHWYVPNNMIVVAVGDFDRARMLELVRERYGKAEARELPERPRTTEPAQDGLRVDVVGFDAQLARVEFGFPLVSAKHPDAAALDVLSQLLGGGYNSLLYTELKRRRDLVHSVSTYAFTPLDAGLFLAGAEVEPERIEETVRALSALLFDPTALAFGDDELDAARTSIISSHVHGQEAYQGVARTLGRFTMVDGDPAGAEAYLERIRGVTAADVRRVAAAWLRPERANVVVLVPDDAPAPASDAVARWVAAPSRDSAALPTIATDVTAAVEVVELPGGIRLLVQTDRKAPLVGIRASMPGGQRAEAAGQEGIADLMTSVWDRGTSLRSAAEIERALDRMGGRLSAGSGRDGVSLFGRFLSDDVRAGFELFFDVLANPSFPEDEVRRERDDQIREIDALPENRVQVALAGFYEAFYGNHPYNHLAIGRKDAVRGLGREDLVAFHRRHLEPSRMVLTIVGDIDAETARRLVLDALPASIRDGAVGAPESTPPAMPERSALVEKVLRQPGQQTHILWGFPTVDMLHEDRHALRVLDAILGGMGGRLFVELRDKKSLAYAVTSFDEIPRDRGSLILYIGCAPDKEAESIREFERVLDEIRRDGVTDEEVQRAKTYLEGVQAIGLQTSGGRTGAYASGLMWHDRWDAWREGQAALREVTAEDVRRVANTWLRPESSVRFVLRAEN